MRRADLLGALGSFLAFLVTLPFAGAFFLGEALVAFGMFSVELEKQTGQQTEPLSVTSFGRKKNSTRERREKRGADEISALDGSPRPSLVICRAF